MSIKCMLRSSKKLKYIIRLINTVQNCIAKKRNQSCVLLHVHKNSIPSITQMQFYFLGQQENAGNDLNADCGMKMRLSQPSV